MKLKIIDETSKRLLIFGALLVVVSTVFVGCSPKPAANLARAETIPVVTSEQSRDIVAEGSVEAEELRHLAFQITGRAETILVVEGDEVSAGDVLIRLEEASLQRAVALAEQTLIIRQANLDTLLAGAKAADLAAAEAALRSAEANLKRLKDGPNAEDVTAAEESLAAARETYQKLVKGPDENDLAQVKARLQAAEASLRQAQAHYDQVSWRNDIGALPQATQLQQATIEFEAAQAAYHVAADGADAGQIAQAKAAVAQAEAVLKQLADSPTPAEVAAGEAAVVQAQSRLTLLMEGASREEIAVAEALVVQARLALEDAQDTLTKATLIAPFDGKITKVHIKEGDLVSAGHVALTIASTGRLQVRTTDLTESDIVHVTLGQRAIVKIDALPGEELAGHVSEIGQEAILYRGDVTYPVVVVLEEAHPKVRLGMTVEVRLARNDSLE